jgi:beta-lactamase regulating signal transducer with metallopeptidase domain/protocatechuate 3,4-dioxygenase beta subunit
MTWHLMIWHWLAQAAWGSLIVLAGACLAAALCRVPARRLRLVELGLLACLVVPWLQLLPGVGQWSLGWLDRLEPAPNSISTPAGEPASPGDHWVGDDAVAAAGTEAAEKDVTSIAAPPVSSADPVGVPEAVAGISTAVGLPLTAVIVLVYVGFVGMALMWWLVGVLKLVRLCYSTSAAPLRVIRLFRRIAGPRGKSVAVLVSDRLALPLTFTWRRPVIVMPNTLCLEADESALRYCLAHEWSHIERRDIWMWQTAALVQVVFFYQPLFWWLRRQLRLCQDYLADARAVEQAPAAEDYAEFLVGLARRRVGHVEPAALGIGDRRSSLYRRVIMLINTSYPLDRRCRAIFSFGCALGIAALLAVAVAVRLDAAPSVPDTKDDTASRAAPEDKSITYTGKVFDKDTGKGIGGATVTVRRATYGDPNGEKILEETKHTTAGDGSYSFAIPQQQAAERYLYIELDVEAPGYAPRGHFGYSFAMIQKNEKMGGRPFFENVDLRPAREIAGVVETPEGKPAVGVKLVAYSNTSKAGKDFEYGSFANAKTDNQGGFRLWLITPGPAVFWVLPDKYAPVTRVLKDPSKRGDVGRFILSPGIVLKGKLLDTKGKRVPNVYVHASKRGGIEDFNLPVADQTHRVTVTNEQGEFEFAPLAAGQYELRPEENGYDPSKDDGRPKKRPLPNLVFLRQRVTLKDGEQPEPIELRAVPHVVIEAQYYDSKGSHTRGHSSHLFGRINKTDYWFGEGKVDADGKMTALVPHGLTEVRLHLSTNEHGVLRHRLKKDDPLSGKHQIDLGTVSDDVKGIEIIRYVAPILLINARDASGTQLKDFQAKVQYSPEKSPKDPKSSFVNGVQGDVYLEKQEDGRWRSSQLLPDEEITVTVSAAGFEPYEEKLKLSEGTTKELTVNLKKK